MDIKNILFGVTGSISAYKTLECIRLLKKRDLRINVKVVMTKSACDFIKPLSFEAISGNSVCVDTFKYTDSAMEHIELARWADKVVIAPASANFISKAASGIADDLLTTLLLASKNKAIIVPSMNMHMWKNSIIQDNVCKLKIHNYKFLGPSSGVQACGDNGFGRMVEPEYIVDYLLELKNKKYQGRVIITAGPTIEAIDPVRYISNHSSGKMGYALANEFAGLGANVLLISGPTSIDKPMGVDIIEVKSAQEMFNAVQDNIDDADIFIGAAAVCDYRVREYYSDKIKKTDSDYMSIDMIKNPDILGFVGNRSDNIYSVGFAAETSSIEVNAKKKLKDKNSDLIILNKIDKESGFPFYANTNCVSIYSKTTAPIHFPELKKSELSIQLVELIIKESTSSNSEV